MRAFAIWLAVFLGIVLVRPAQAAKVVVGIPLAATVEANTSLSWRDAKGKRGTDNNLALKGLQYPVQLRGSGWASSGSRNFPLPSVLAQVEGKAYAVLELDMAEYLAGVVPHEMHPNWPDEALKAQTVLARTFALRRQQERQNSGWPIQVIAGTQDQEYRWTHDVAPRMLKLVRSTGNAVMRTRAGSLAQVFYHSCSGGMTADAGEIWHNAVAGIIPVEDPNDSICPDYFWSLVLSPEELGGSVGLFPVTSIRIAAIGPSGRVTAIEFGDGRQTKTMAGLPFRNAVGATRIKSTLFSVRAIEVEGTPTWQFQGSGSGHGVGLSQFGAKTMAEEGKTHREILQFYFPQLVLESR